MHWKQATWGKNFGDPSLSTGTIAKFYNNTIQLEKAAEKRVQGLKQNSSLNHEEHWLVLG